MYSIDTNVLLDYNYLSVYIIIYLLSIASWEELRLEKPLIQCAL